ncbi:SDR family NAD(P)-dependent oxidoreductase [Streptomyces syringium]|uniref:SDR family NAD(P)-dependent oxidoreductase n=1 Tax=Streptomyces syringium TaxID=76729 RepID=UPI0034518EE6
MTADPTQAPAQAPTQAPTQAQARTQAPAQELAGTTALVTGASSGIGEATALALAAQGACVVLAARRRDRLEKTAATVTAAGGRAVVAEADLSGEAGATAAVSAAVAATGRLDIVVNSAGVLLLGPVEDAPTEEWHRMVNVNLLGTALVTRAALPHLLRAAADGPRHVADLVNVSSLGGRVATANTAVYNAAKFGVNGFSEALRQEVARRHLRVCVVEPGFVATELPRHSRPEVLEALAGGFDPGEPMRPADIAGTIVHVVTRPRHMAIGEVLLRPAEQLA